MMKKVLFCCLFITFGLIFASTKKNIVCVSFAEYDWTKNIIGQDLQNIDLTLLQKNGADLHNFQPSVKDIAKISTCDMLVFVGGESQDWIEKALKNSSNKDIVVVNLLEILGDKAKQEEIIEGMQVDLEQDKDENTSIEYDEHIWLSIKNAMFLTQEISKQIQNLDPENSVLYKNNTTKYLEKLSKLDTEFSQVIKESKNNIVLFGDRYPFRYLSEDYNLKYYAAFVGCSAESEANFDTIIFLAHKVDELGLKYVLTLEKSDKKIASTIVKSTKNKNQEIRELNSLQSITQKEIKLGASYISEMEKNLKILQEVLN